MKTKTSRGTWVAKTFHKCRECEQVHAVELGRFRNRTFDQMLAMTFDGEGRRGREQLCTARETERKAT